MIKTNYAIACLLVACGATHPGRADSIGSASVQTWKDGQTAAASFTIDDNWQEDHAWWIAKGNEFDIRFTWFVISGNVGTGNPDVRGNWSDFVALQAAGHDLQSHTVDHFPNSDDLENFPSGGPLTVEANYAQAITDIESNVPGSQVLTLAYPRGLKLPNDKALAAQHYIAARGVKGTLNTLTGVDYLEVNQLSAKKYGELGGFPLPGNAAANENRYVPNLITPGKAEYEGWLTVLSHGITTATNDRKEALSELLTYLTATPGEFWIAPFTNVAQYAQERDAAQLTTQVITANEIEYTLTDTLDDAQFSEPLTVKVRVDNAWDEIVAMQAGLPLPATLIQEGGEQFAIVNSVPDLGVVSLTQLIADPTADFDTDGDTDGADFLAWQRGFGVLTNATLPQGDANFDGAVGSADLAVWQNQYAAAAPIVTSVPEPSSIALFLAGCCVWKLRAHPRTLREGASGRESWHF